MSASDEAASPWGATQRSEERSAAFGRNQIEFNVERSFCLGSYSSSSSWSSASRRRTRTRTMFGRTDRSVLSAWKRHAQAFAFQVGCVRHDTLVWRPGHPSKPHFHLPILVRRRRTWLGSADHAGHFLPRCLAVMQWLVRIRRKRYDSRVPGVERAQKNVRRPTG